MCGPGRIKGSNRQSSMPCPRVRARRRTRVAHEVCPMFLWWQAAPASEGKPRVVAREEWMPAVIVVTPRTSRVLRGVPASPGSLGRRTRAAPLPRERRALNGRRRDARSLKVRRADGFFFCSDRPVSGQPVSGPTLFCWVAGVFGFSCPPGAADRRRRQCVSSERACKKMRLAATCGKKSGGGRATAAAPTHSTPVKDRRLEAPRTMRHRRSPSSRAGAFPFQGEQRHRSSCRRR